MNGRFIRGPIVSFFVILQSGFWLPNSFDESVLLVIRAYLFSPNYPPLCSTREKREKGKIFFGPWAALSNRHEVILTLAGASEQQSRRQKTAFASGREKLSFLVETQNRALHHFIFPDLFETETKDFETLCIWSSFRDKFVFFFILLLRWDDLSARIGWKKGFLCSKPEGDQSRSRFGWPRGKLQDRESSEKGEEMEKQE